MEHVVNSLAGTQITTHSVKRNPGSGKERLATKCATPTLRLSRLTGGSPRTVVDALAKRLETQHMLQNQLIGSKITLPLAIRMLKVNPVAEDGEPEFGQWLSVATRLQVFNNPTNVLQRNPMFFSQLRDDHECQQVDESVVPNAAALTKAGVHYRLDQPGPSPVVHLPPAET